MGAPDTELLEESLPAVPPIAPWALLAGLPQRLAASGDPGGWRSLLREAHEELKARFFAGEPVEELVHARAALIDAVLCEAWRRHCETHCAAWALVAVGGYGRGELHPCSDVDILLLIAESSAGRDEAIASFIAALWDLGLEVGHSVRTVAECVEQAPGDVGVATSLMEARRVLGDDTLFQKLRAATGPQRIWPSQVFF